MKLETIVYKFYQGLEEGKLYGRKCRDCGEIEFPPKPALEEALPVEVKPKIVQRNGYKTLYFELA